MSKNQIARLDERMISSINVLNVFQKLVQSRYETKQMDDVTVDQPSYFAQFLLCFARTVIQPDSSLIALSVLCAFNPESVVSV